MAELQVKVRVQEDRRRGGRHLNDECVLAGVARLIVSDCRWRMGSTGAGARTGAARGTAGGKATRADGRFGVEAC